MDRILDLKAPKEFTHDTVKAIASHGTGTPRCGVQTAQRAIPTNVTA